MTHLTTLILHCLQHKKAKRQPLLDSKTLRIAARVTDLTALSELIALNISPEIFRHLVSAPYMIWEPNKSPKANRNLPSHNKSPSFVPITTP